MSCRTLQPLPEGVQRVARVLHEMGHPHAAGVAVTVDQNTICCIAATAGDIRAAGQKHAKDLPSPCRSVCQMDEASGLCQGCLRTLDEIAAWGSADEAAKRQIWRAIEARALPLLDVGADGLSAIKP